MTGSTLRPQLQTALINQLTKTSTRKKNPLQKGFTLVELMVVIVIVAILSAVALPNFLKQTDKAKATEAKTALASILKQAQADYVESGNAPKESAADLRTYYGAPPADKQKFNYAGTGTYSATNKIYTVAATGSTAPGKDDNLAGKVILGCINLESGVVEISQNLLASGTTTDANVTCN